VKFVAKANALAVATRAAASAIDDKAAKRSAFLGALLINADHAGLRFVATDLDVAIAANCAATVAEAGRGATPGGALAKLLCDIAPDTEVSVETVDSRLQVKAGGSRYRLPALLPEDFPTAPATTSTSELVLSHNEVRHLFGSVAFAMNTEGARVYLRGVYLHCDARGHLCGVATDGHRLALASSAITPAPHALPANGDSVGVIIPIKTVFLISKLKAAEIELRADDRVIEIRAGDLLIASRLIDGTFPDYQRIVPAESSSVATLEREALLAALKRLRAVRDAAEQNINVELSWRKGADAIRMAVADLGEDFVAAETTGAAEIALSVTQMLTMAEEITEAKQLRLGVSDKLSPIRIAAGADFLAVLAPCVR
jgi:DNA polymerase III subunit beta